MTVPLDELRTLLEAATARPWRTAEGEYLMAPSGVATGRIFSPYNLALVVAAVNHLDALIACAEAAQAVRAEHWFVVRSEGTAKVLIDALAALTQEPSVG